MSRRAGTYTANLRAIPRIMEMTVKQTVMDGFILFTILIQPFLVALMGVWMLRDRGAAYAMYIIVGSGMTGLWSSELFICGNAVNMERFSGTLETLVGVPTSLATIVFGKNLANVAQSLISMVVAYLLTAVIFGYPVRVAHPVMFCVSLVLVTVAFISFGLFLSPLFVMNPAIQQWQNGLEFPVFLLSGFLCPVAMLPVWSVPIRDVLPTYWAARSLHLSADGGVGAGALAAGGFYHEIIVSWSVLLASSAVFVLIGSWLFTIMIRKAKVDATLDIE